MNHSQAIVDAILSLQRKNRNISAQDLTTNIILILLSQHKEANLARLMELLHCPQAYLTHFLKRLIKSKLICMRQDKTDLRFRYYALTAHGEAEVKSLDKHYDSVLNSQTAKQSRSEISCLASYFRRLSDNAGIAAQNKRSHEHIIRPEQRRLAAFIGVTGRTLFFEKISPTTFHILKLLSRYDGLLTTKNISDELNLTSPQVSSILKAFSESGWIKYAENYFDDRSRLISLSAKGQLHYNELATVIYQRVGSYLRNFKDSELVKFAELAQNFMKSSLETESIAHSDNSKHRVKILEFSYLNKTLGDVPERIAGHKDKLFCLRISGEIVCYVQVRMESNEINLLAWMPNLPLSNVRDLLAITIKESGAHLGKHRNILDLFNKSLK